MMDVSAKQSERSRIGNLFTLSSDDGEDEEQNPFSKEASMMEIKYTKETEISEDTDTEDVETEQVETEPMETEQLETEPLETEVLETEQDDVIKKNNDINICEWEQ